jgi:RNA polymerase sigma-54 factor
MQMSQVLSQRLEMKLKMTTQMIQSIEMLQLPMMALEQIINQELINNPALEMLEDAGEEPDEDAPPEPAPEPRIERDVETAESEDEARAFRESSRVIRDGDDDAKMDAMQNAAARGETLQDHLVRQLHILDEPPRIKELAEYLVYNLDPTGYLPIPDGAEGADGWRIVFDGYGRDENGQIAQDVVQPAPPEMDEALALVQSLDPAGMASRTVEECLMRQLERDPGDRAFEATLVRGHFDDLIHNRLPRIAKAMGASLERVREAREFIARLNPKPGSTFSAAPRHYIVPDVIVEEIGGEYFVRMNDGRLPRLRVSGLYRQLLASEERGSRTRDYIREKIQAARWLIDSIEQRRRTIYRIACEIVDIQKEFLREGISRLKPLKMQEIADRIGMHVSTVGRAIADKYIDTPQGVFPMKFFFAGGFESAGGEAESNKAIMDRIRQMIDGEDKRSPLSDQEIVERLREQGIDIARRTVAKYREKLNVASSRQRKQF